MHNKLYEVPPLDPLLAFESAARNLSFTRAGQELALTQSAVSRQIQSLEDYLGVKLFERRTRALLLTNSGQDFYRLAQEVLQSVHDGAGRLRGQTEARAVTVTTTPGFAALWLIPRLTGFTKAHPGVDVRISAANEVVNVNRAGFDLAIRYAPAASESGARRLFGETVYPVCSPALKRDPKRPLKEPSDLRHHVILHLDDPKAAWIDWQLWFHALGLTDFKGAGKAHFSHYDQLIQAAVNGQGIALGRDPLTKQLIRQKKLVAPFRQDVVSSRSYFLIESDAGRGKTQVQAFVEWLLQESVAA